MVGSARHVTCNEAGHSPGFPRINATAIPRSPHTLPRPLTAEQDQLLQQEFIRRNDLGGNVFLLLRSTGMRIGECVDLSDDCLHSTGPSQWAIHVPLGKLKTERMVPVDAFGRDLVQRLRFFRSLDPLPLDGRLLARPGSKVAIVVQLRDYLHRVCHSPGLPTAIVPHQFRHTYATETMRRLLLRGCGCRCWSGSSALKRQPTPAMGSSTVTRR